MRSTSRSVGFLAAIIVVTAAAAAVDAADGAGPAERASAAVQPGDLLVTSPTPGHAIRIDAPLPGTVVGKTLEPLDAGQGLVRVLVMLR